MSEIDIALLKELNEQRLKAAEARKHWASYEESLKDRIMNIVGVSKSDPKLRSDVSVPNVVKIEFQSGTHLDQKYLKEHYPAIAAECERTHWKSYFVKPE